MSFGQAHTEAEHMKFNSWDLGQQPKAPSCR